MAKATKKAALKTEPAKSKDVEVTVNGSASATPVTVRVNGNLTKFEYGKPKMVLPSVLEALKATSGIDISIKD